MEKLKGKLDLKSFIIIGLVLLIIIFIVLTIVQSNVNKNVDKKFELSEAEKNTIRQEVIEEIENGVEENVGHLDDGTRINSSQKMLEKRAIREDSAIEVSNMKITASNRNSVIVVQAKNVSQEEQGDYLAMISFLDKDGKELFQVGIHIPKLAPLQTVEVTTSATTDIANAYDYVIYKAN